jgi:ferredoxin
MVDGKALIDLRQLNQCDLDGQCVEVCPTDVVTLLVQSAEPVAAETGAAPGKQGSLTINGPLSN